MEDWYEMEVPCSSCGELTEVEITSDGNARNGHFSTVLVSEEEKFREDVNFPTETDEIVDFEMDENSHATVYAECPDCCPYCNDLEE